jgi:gamma-glutamylputrescine oxidase
MISRLTQLSGEPIWREAMRPSATSLPQGPRFDSTRIRADVAIIGGGFTGLSAAYHVLAANPGAVVVLLEAHQIGYGASSRNSGMLTPGVGQNLVGLVNRLGPAAARAMYETSLEAVKYVEELTKRERIDAALNMSGQLVLAYGRSGRRRLAKQAAMLERLSLPNQPLSDADLRARLTIGAYPRGTDRDGPAALRLPVAGVLHPGRMLQGLREAVLLRGGHVLEGAKASSISSEGRVVVQLADSRKVIADDVVIASSGYDSALNIHRGRLIPLHLRVILSDRLSPEQLARLRWPGGEGVIDSRRLFNYFRLTHDNRILFGGGRPQYLWGGDRSDLPTHGPEVDRLIEAFRGFFPALPDLPIARTWTGVIAYSIDALPVVDWVPGRPRVIFVGGWCGHGIALSMLSGKWIKQMIATGKPVEYLPWFRHRSRRVPTEAARWAGALIGTRSMELLDHL